jgi:UDP-glucose:(heptosyl)LPS alpha-1,3-glucosyltransferase
VAEPCPREITIVANDIRPEGGMELQLTVLVTGLLGAGHDVTVISRTCELPPHPRLRWIRVRGPGRPFTIAYPWFLLAASVLVGRHSRGLVHSTGAIVLGQVDVSTVHFCHLAFSSVPGSRASRDSFAYRANAWLARRISELGERWCYRPGRARRLVPVSDGVARELRRHFPRMRERVTTIPNGVNTDRFAPAPVDDREDRPAPADGSPLQALFVGGDWARKGLGIAIEALRECRGVELTVVGAGDEEAYGRLARELGVDERVRFAGATRDAAAWYRRADVFVLPTAYETFSLVTYEAAACGLPLLVTRVNGVEDLIRDGINGWFVEREPADVAARLRELQADPARRRAMGGAARDDSLEYSWGRVVERYRELYAELAGAPAAR